MSTISKPKAARPIRNKPLDSRKRAQPVPAARALVLLGTRWQFYGTAAALFVLLFLRRPDALLNAQLWAEDGAVFLREQLIYGFWRTALVPYPDYLLLVPRLIATLGSLLPAAWVPLAFNSIALLIAAICCSLFVLPAYRKILQSDLQRFLVCVLIACVPYADEISANIANIQFYLVIAAILIVFREPVSGSPPTRMQAILIGLAGAVIACSSALSIIVLPFLIWKLLRSPSTDRIWAGMMTAGCTIQLATILINHVNSTTRVWNEILTSTVISFVYRVVLCQVGGMRLAGWIAAHGSRGIVLSALVGVAIWLTWLQYSSGARTRRALWVSLYLMAASLGIAMAGRESLRKEFLSLAYPGTRSERYFFLPACLLILLVALSIRRFAPSARPLVAAVLLILPFSGGLVMNFRIRPYEEMHWAEKAEKIDLWQRAWNAGQSVQGILAPINPGGPWAIALPTRRAAATRDSRWEGLFVSVRGRPESYLIVGGQRHLIQDRNYISEQGLRWDADLVWINRGKLLRIPVGAPAGSAKFSTISVTPSSGTQATATFTAVYRNDAGFDQFSLVQLYMPGNDGGGKNACWVYYEPGTNTLWLRDDGQDRALGPLTPGGSPFGTAEERGSVENTQCALHAAGSLVSGSGTDLTVTYAISFKPAFAGQRSVFLYAQDLAWHGTGWQGRGVWSVPSGRQ